MCEYFLEKTDIQYLWMGKITYRSENIFSKMRINFSLFSSIYPFSGMDLRNLTAR
jgi:hypothetical protein